MSKKHLLYNYYAIVHWEAARDLDVLGVPGPHREPVAYCIWLTSSSHISHPSTEDDFRCPSHALKSC